MENPAKTRSFHINAGPDRVRVLFAGHELADSDDVLIAREEGHSDVFYFPRDHVDMASLRPNDHRTTCPLKGEASHFSMMRDGEVVENLAWSYEDPLPRAELLEDRIAFYPQHVEFEVTAGGRDSPRHVPAHDPPYIETGER